MSDAAMFEMAQTLRRSHCDRPGQGHECVGEVTIKRGIVCLNCTLCGKGEHMPGWNSNIAFELEGAFEAAGMDWRALNVEAQVAAIRAVESRRKL